MMTGISSENWVVGREADVVVKVTEAVAAGVSEE